MELYAKKSASLPQELLSVVRELALIVTSYQVLLGPWLPGLRAFGDSPSFARNATLFGFNLCRRPKHPPPTAEALRGVRPAPAEAVCRKPKAA